METTPVEFEYTKKDGSKTTPAYFFGYAATNPGSDNIDLIVQLNDEKELNVGSINTSYSKEVLNLPSEKHAALAKELLDDFYAA